VDADVAIQNMGWVRRGDVRHHRTLAALAIAAVVFAGACGSDKPASESKAASPTTAAATSGAKVTMKLIAFKPASLTVAAGTSVTWTQTDPGFHTVTSGTVEQGTGGVTAMPDGTFDSGQLATGKTFSHTFDTPGTYTYFCNVHPATMRADVRVT
jgi:plastocyanin